MCAGPAYQSVQKGVWGVWHRHLAGVNTGWKPVPQILQQAARLEFCTLCGDLQGFE